MAAIVERTLAGWAERYRDGDEVDLFEAFSPLTLQVVAEVVCGVQVKDVQRLIHAFRDALENLLERGSVAREIPLWVPTPGNLRARRALATLNAIVEEEISRAQAEGEERGEDLLGALLQARHPVTGEPLTRRELRDELVTMLLAGHETVALTLTWAFERLAALPEVRQALQDEADRVLDGGPVGASVVEALSYTRRVVHEVLRVRSPAWIVARTCVADDAVRGFRVPAGTTVLLPQLLVHEHPDFWKEPQRFDPERFTPEASKGRREEAYFPFSRGPRMCIGSHLGLVETTLALAMLARRLSFEPVGTEPPGFNALNALHPSPPLRMRVRWRR
jgi:cytochrome P450